MQSFWVALHSFPVFSLYSLWPSVLKTIKSLFKFQTYFLTLCLCFEYFHNDLRLFNEESALDAIPDTFSTHETTIGLADVFLRFRQPHENFSLTARTPLSRPGGSGQPGFVRGCIVGQPTTVRQMLHHPECL
ncbi:hypothetical protein FD755_017414 [Muntiacus reevesi]|uniref:Uncharacterized protein n=1 Tax=Muntiacus reevesi TaxID=9886 RepID=A0A5N3XBG2_MUNRE|nr:hypothetical protein FD755_017414 [Muntiacus reevesi]